ncbi:hypothetical protein ACFLWA_00715 [Chloroflexota bacterium]
MERGRELIVTNLVALLLLLIVLVVGWKQAAAFGLAVLVMMNVFVLLRERLGRSSQDSLEEEEK